MSALAQQIADDFATPPADAKEVFTDRIKPGKTVSMAAWKAIKLENDGLRAECSKLRKMNDELAIRENLVNAVPRPIQALEFSEECVNKRIIPELKAMADQGATQAEWLAAWDISEEQWEAWCSTTPLLKAESLRARVRAKAVFEAIFRKALMSGDRAFPFAKWVDIMDQRYGSDDKEAKGSANDVDSKGGRCEVCRDIILED